MTIRNSLAVAWPCLRKCCLTNNRQRLLPIAEARELVTVADNVLVVARWRESTEGSIRAAIKLLPLQSISHIGVALNGIDLRKKLQLGGNDATAFYNRYKSYYRSELA